MIFLLKSAGLGKSPWSSVFIGKPPEINLDFID
jgi:hypothetical protein